MLNKHLEIFLQKAFEKSRLLAHSFVGVEHLLYVVIQEEIILNWIKTKKIDLKKEIISKLESHFYTLPKLKIKNKYSHLKLTINSELKNIIKFSVAIGSIYLDTTLIPFYILLSIINFDRGVSGKLLRELKMGFIDILKYIKEFDSINNKFKNINEMIVSGLSNGIFLDNTFKVDQQNVKNNSNYLKNLTKQASDKKLDPLFGRDEELKRVLQILSRIKKCNPILLGEAGVGKSTLVEGLAYYLLNNRNIPLSLVDSVIFELDLSSFMSGTKYRGDLEHKFKSMVEFLENYPKSILFLDEIHMLVGAGNTSGGHIDLSNLFKPFLSKGKFKFIGATTIHEYQNTIEKDKALARRFQKVYLTEPNHKEAFEIISGLKDIYEEHHNVKYPNSVIKAAIELTDKYIHDRYLPDKALDLLDEVGALHQNTNKTQVTENDKKIKTIDLKKVLYQVFNRPLWGPFSKETFPFKDLSEYLNNNLLGQKQAIKLFINTLKYNLSSLKWQSNHKYVGAYLLVGPHGVGKTSLPILLTEYLKIPLLKINMSEYSESHVVSSIVGAPPGYVGHDKRSKFLQMLLENPHSVLLLDEIEKAHPMFFNILNNILEDGFIIDNTGKKISLQHVLIIATSNICCKVFSKIEAGFYKMNTSNLSKKAIEEALPIQLINKFDKIIHYVPVQIDSMCELLRSFINELKVNLSKTNIDLSITDYTFNSIIKKCLCKKMNIREFKDYLTTSITHKIIEMDIEPIINNIVYIEIIFLDDDISISIDSKTKNKLKKYKLKITN